MSLAAEVEVVRRAPIFSDIPPSLYKMLCFSSDRLTYAAGQVMFREGDAPDAAFIVVEGTVQISVNTPQGPRVVNQLGCGDVLGESGIFGATARTATAIAASRVDAIRVTRELFSSVLRACPDAALRLNRQLAQRLASTTAQLGASARGCG